MTYVGIFLGFLAVVLTTSLHVPVWLLVLILAGLIVWRWRGRKA